MSVDTTEDQGQDQGPGEPTTPAADPVLALGPPAAPGPIEQVVGLGGDVIPVPSGVWFAATDDNGNLLRDADGVVIRVRSPHRPPRRPGVA